MGYGNQTDVRRRTRRDLRHGAGDAQHIDVRADDVPDAAYGDEFAIEALGCLKATDEPIHVRLARALSDPREWIASGAAKALAAMKPPEIDVQQALADQLRRPEEGARSGAAQALRELRPSDPRVLEAIRRNDPTFAIDWPQAQGS